MPNTTYTKLRSYGWYMSILILSTSIITLIISILSAQQHIATTTTAVKTELQQVVSQYQQTHLRAMDSVIERSTIDSNQFTSAFGLQTNSVITSLTTGTTALQFIDLREPTSWQHGSIPGALRIRLGDLLNDTEFTWYHLNTTYIFVCHTGTTSYVLVDLLRKQGFPNVYFIAGGIYNIVPNDPDFPFVGEYQERLTVPQAVKNPKTTGASIALVTSWLDMRQDTSQPAPHILSSQTSFSARSHLYWETSTTPTIDQHMARLSDEERVGIICDSRLSCYTAEVAVTLYPDIAWVGIYDTRRF